MYFYNIRPINALSFVFIKVNRFTLKFFSGCFENVPTAVFLSPWKPQMY